MHHHYLIYYEHIFTYQHYQLHVCLIKLVSSLKKSLEWNIFFYRNTFLKGGWYGIMEKKLWKAYPSPLQSHLVSCYNIIILVLAQMLWAGDRRMKEVMKYFYIAHSGCLLLQDHLTPLFILSAFIWNFLSISVLRFLQQISLPWYFRHFIKSVQHSGAKVL